MNFYKRWIADYANDTRHLTFAEHGAYNILLDILYSTEKPIPKNQKLIRLLSGSRSSTESATVQKILKEFFILTRWGWTHKRFIHEKKAMDARVSAGSVNGKKGGRPRKYAPDEHTDERQKKGRKKVNKGTLDSRLQTLEPESQDQAAAVVLQEPENRKPTATAAIASFVATSEQIRGAFEAIRSEPFGRREFQNIFAAIIYDGEISSWSDAMERTIQCCRECAIVVPGRFFTIKHMLEKLEAHASFQRTPT